MHDRLGLCRRRSLWNRGQLYVLVSIVMTMASTGRGLKPRLFRLLFCCSEFSAQEHSRALYRGNRDVNCSPTQPPTRLPTGSRETNYRPPITRHVYGFLRLIPAERFNVYSTLLRSVSLLLLQVTFSLERLLTLKTLFARSSKAQRGRPIQSSSLFWT